jgi:hypothetical protein
MGGAGDEVEPPVVLDEVIELGVDLAESQAQLAQELKAFSGVTLEHGPAFHPLGHVMASMHPLLRLVDEGFGIRGSTAADTHCGAIHTRGRLLGRSNYRGAVHYLQGCLHALDGNHKQALKPLVDACKLGRESCGRFWIDLLRLGLMTAERVKSKRERKNFAKQARLFGLFSNDATPRTNEMIAQMNEDDFRRSWFGSFKPFPLVSSAHRA